MQINILNTDQKKLQKRKPKKEDMKAKRSNTILSYAHSLNQAITSSLVTLDVHASLGFFFSFTETRAGWPERLLYGWMEEFGGGGGGGHVGTEHMTRTGSSLFS
jgi:hypothetical protein